MSHHPSLKSSPLAAQITRRAKSNLALSFFSLPKDKREAMEVFYSFCRRVDDIADDEGIPAEVRRAQLARWQDWISEMYLQSPEDPLACALSEVVRKYFIPPDYLREIVHGVEMDLDKTHYSTWSELEQYCYRVASCVGLVSIEIFGYRHSSTREYARLLGLALQTTNILRDVQVDLRKGRIYLPEEDFIACGISSELLKNTVDKFELLQKNAHQLRPVLQRMATRAEYFFCAAQRSLHPDDRSNMIAAQVMAAVYSDILRRLRKRNFSSLFRPEKIRGTTKLFVALHAQRHELRHAQKRSLPPAQKVVIIGAGAAGLAAATFLAKSAHNVTLIESRAGAGGRTHSWPDNKLGITLDNGQHVLMGCYRETLNWIAMLGGGNALPACTQLDVSYAIDSGRRARLSAPQNLPSPLHLLHALGSFKALNQIEKFTTSRVILSAQNSRGAWHGQTVAGWLKHCGQSENVIRTLWEPIALAALNESIFTGAAELFRNVILEAFTGSASNSHVIIPRAGLTTLYVQPSLEFLKFTGARVLLGATAQSLRCAGDRVTGVSLRDGTEIPCDALIIATPWAAAAKLLAPIRPELATKISRLTGSPIVGIHLVLERELFPEPFLGLLPSPIQWIFHLNKTQNIPPDRGHHYAITISAAHREVDLPREELVALALAELTRFLPEARGVHPRHSFVYKAREATFAATPDNLPYRPSCHEAGANIFLAGGWTDTGLPDTIEGAVRSAKNAAQLLENSESNI